MLSGAGVCARKARTSLRSASGVMSAAGIEPSAPTPAAATARRWSCTPAIGAWMTGSFRPRRDWRKWAVMPPRLLQSRRGLLLHDDHHPAHAEAVLHHAEARREERLGERLVDLAAVGQAGERLLRRGLVGDLER